MISSKSIKALVEKHLHECTFCVETLADKLQISPSFLRELTRKYFNKTPHQYIESRRLQRALSLLPLHKRIYEICKLVGYNCVRSFRRAFTLAFGMTPSEYRVKILHMTV
jgi:AraC-like DNA-binding protein